MRAQRILSFICINLLLIAFPLLQAQERSASATTNGTELEEEVPFYNGLLISVDLFGVGNELFGGDYMSSEISIEANLKNRFYPVLEAGFGTTDTWNDNGIHYKSAAPFFRIGMNYNTMYKKNSRNYLYVGARYGFSTFTYDVKSMEFEDPLFGGSLSNPNLIDDIWWGSVPYNHSGMKGTLHWFEIVTGVRARIWKDLSMGWTVRLKYHLSSSTSEYGDPWYVPGFGKYSSNLGVTYTITYKLPF
ncbi:MAG: DUF6048 family protein [Bacteroides sp.]|nr:DUF6048 family protein [Bacteroides sp.]